jgi:AcrR family transcriptional regulator
MSRAVTVEVDSPRVDPPRRRYATRQPRAVRREQILDATLRLIAREGWAAMTMERIAAEAEIAKSVIYAVFGSQADLQRAVMQREQERAFKLAAESLAAASAADELLASVTAALTTWLDGVARDPDTWRLVLMPIDGAPASVRAAIGQGRERWRRAIEPLAAAALARAGLQDADTELVAHLVRGNAEYLARLMLERPKSFTPARLTALLVALLQR